MAAEAASLPLAQVDEQTYKRRIWAWTMYDWGNSAFATTILAALLPAYYSSVAGATLPSEATATAYWSLGLSLSLLIVAVLSPILGTISDVMRGKKRYLSIFAGVGIVGTGLLVLVGTGDWMLASLLFVFGRIGFTGSIVFYDALLPHVAKEEDQDMVSSRGFAMGYLGGGLLLAINVAMIQLIPDSLFEYAGIRLSFLSVAVWWAVFTIPVLRTVPEPPAATAQLKPGETVIGVSFRRLMTTFREVRRYSELFKFLIAFLIYNDGIGTIIGVAVIYGAELGFGTLELVLALLLVQFAGIPFSLIFGRLPSEKDKRRHYYLAFVLFNLVALPLTGLTLANALPGTVSGAPQPAFETVGESYGEGVYLADGGEVVYDGAWENVTVLAEDSGLDVDVVYAITDEVGAAYSFAFNGQAVEVTYAIGPDRGIWAVELDGEALLDDDGEPLRIDGYSETVRYGVVQAFTAGESGEHVLTLVNTGEANAESAAAGLTFAQVVVLPPARQSSLPTILGVLLAVQAVGVAFAFATGRFFKGLAATMDTRRSIVLALVVYSVIAIWGFLLNSTVEYWFLAWMVAIVQGGSQALSRSLYASMSPKAKSGEFFGLYGVMEKFSAIIGPILFAAAVAIFDSSRPAILSLIALFVIGGFLLGRVDIAEGRRVARAEDAATLGAG